MRLIVDQEDLSSAVGSCRLRLSAKGKIRSDVRVVNRKNPRQTGLCTRPSRGMSRITNGDPRTTEFSPACPASCRFSVEIHFHAAESGRIGFPSSEGQGTRHYFDHVRRASPPFPLGEAVPRRDAGGAGEVRSALRTKQAARSNCSGRLVLSFDFDAPDLSPGACSVRFRRTRSP